VNGNKYGDERETVTNRETKAMALSCAGGIKKKKDRERETALAQETVLLITN